jgi:hypothetical protein
MTEYIVNKTEWPEAPKKNVNRQDKRLNTPASRVYKQLCLLKEGEVAAVPVDGPKGAQLLRMAIFRFRKLYNPDTGFRSKAVQTESGYVLYFRKVEKEKMRHAVSRNGKQPVLNGCTDHLPPLPVPPLPTPQPYVARVVQQNSESHHTSYAN